MRIFGLNILTDRSLNAKAEEMADRLEPLFMILSTGGKIVINDDDVLTYVLKKSEFLALIGLNTKMTNRGDHLIWERE